MNNSILLNLFLVILPFLFSLDKRVKLFGDWKATVAAVGMAGNLAYLLKIGLLRFQMISYSSEPSLQGGSTNMPVASVLFCFTLPFFGLALYRYLNAVFPKNDLEKYSLALSNILMGLCVAMIFFAYTKFYPVITFSILLLLLLFVEYKNKYRFMYKYYRTYGIFVLLYAAAQFLSAGDHKLFYKVERTVEFNVAGVPFENYFLLGILLLIVVYLFELFRDRSHAA